MNHTHTFNGAMLLTAALLVAGPLQATCMTANNQLTNSKPDELYIDHNDGTVTDRETGLMWTRCALGIEFGEQSGGGQGCNSGDSIGSAIDYSDWEAAVDAVNDQNDNELLGYDNWRLPNIKELSSLADSGCSGTALSSANQKSLNADIFDVTLVESQSGQVNKTELHRLWSSTPSPNNNNEVYILRVNDGRAVRNAKSGTFGEHMGVLLVRTPE